MATPGKDAQPNIEYQDPLVACIEDVQRGLQLQATFLLRCVDLYPSPSPALSLLVRKVVKDLSEVSDASCAELRSEIQRDIKNSEVEDSWLIGKRSNSKELSTNTGTKLGKRHAKEPNGASNKLQEPMRRQRSNESRHSSPSGNADGKKVRISQASQGEDAEPESPELVILERPVVKHAREDPFSIPLSPISRLNRPGPTTCAAPERPGPVSERPSGTSEEVTGRVPGKVTPDDESQVSSQYSSEARVVSADRSHTSSPEVNVALSHNSSVGKEAGLDPVLATHSESESQASTAKDGPPVGRKTTIERFVKDAVQGKNSGRRVSMHSCMDIETEEVVDDSNPSTACIDGVMNPNAPFRLCWDLLVIVLVLIDAMILPFQMAFMEDEESVFLDIVWLSITTAFFASDMVASLLTAYQAGNNEPNTPPGKLVTKKRRIARNYLRSWFIVDFASTVPWGKFSDLVSGGGNSSTAGMTKLTKLVKFVRFLRLMRMLRLAKLATIWERAEAHIGNLFLKQAVQLFKVLSVLVGICHWNACIWWMIGNPTGMIPDMMSDETRADWANQRHWTTEVFTYGIGADTQTFQWIDRKRGEAYIFCFYWTLGVMRTMPSEVQPVNLAERVFVMVFMFFAFSVFAICIALITQTFFKFSERKRMFDDECAAVRSYLRTIDAPDGVQQSVKAFLRHMFDRRKIMAKETLMLQNLPSSLQALLKQARLYPHLRHLTVMQDLPDRAYLHVSEIAQVKDLAPGTFLCKKGRVVEAAYVVMQGRVADDRAAASMTEKLLPREDAIDGECLLHTFHMVSGRSLVAAVCSEVMRIDRREFFLLMTKHDDFMRSFKNNMMWDLHTGSLMDERKSEENTHEKQALAQQAQMAAISAIVAS